MMVSIDVARLQNACLQLSQSRLNMAIVDYRNASRWLVVTATGLKSYRIQSTEDSAVPRGKRSGIYQKFKAGTTEPDEDTRVADFAYENVSLAELIVEAWRNDGLKNSLIQGNHNARSAAAKQVLAARGIYLSKPIIITESEYDNGFVWENADDNVVFVLPNESRVAAAQAPTLVETARLLMAYVPNGI